MSLGFLIGFVLVFIIYNLNCQYNSIIYINNIIIEQKAEIILINNICQTLLLSYINNDINPLKKNYIHSCIIIIMIDIILFISLIIIIMPHPTLYNLIPSIILILIFSLFIIFLINYFGYIYIKQTKEPINIKETEIKIKKEEIDNIYITNLLRIFDTKDDIEYINNNIDEYISNYSYLYSSIRTTRLITNSIMIINNNNKNKQIVINEIKNKLIKNKNENLTNIMNINLKNIILITPDIVKNELTKLNENLEDYKNKLETKIKMIIELSQINYIIININ